MIFKALQAQPHNPLDPKGKIKTIARTFVTWARKLKLVLTLVWYKPV